MPPSMNRGTPENDEGHVTEKYGPTLTFQEQQSFNRRPSEVYHYLGKLRTVVQALPELRVLRLINGDTYFWKLEYGESFSLEGELHFTQREQGDIVLWQTTEGSSTQVTGSMRFHAADQPADDSGEEAPQTNLTTTVHLRVPSPLMETVGREVLENKVSTSLREALIRVKNRLDETVAPPEGLKREVPARDAGNGIRDKKGSPLR